jgi:Putative beta barrel porin-7 (BBP7)
MRIKFLGTLTVLAAGAASVRAQNEPPLAVPLPVPAPASAVAAADDVAPLLPIAPIEVSRQRTASDGPTASTADVVPASAVEDGTPPLLPIPPIRPSCKCNAPDRPAASAPAVKCLPEPCQVCKPAPRFWGSLEYLVWYNRSEAVPPLATVGPVGGFGALTAPATVAVLGGHNADFGAFTGFRATVGGWLDRDATVGAEVGGFLLERRSDSVRLTDHPLATDPNLLARPYVDAATGTEASFPVAVPGLAGGAIYAKASSRTWGLDGDGVVNLRNRSLYRVDLLGGFRYLDLLERFNVGQVTTIGPDDTAGIAIYDQFGARNQFYGGQLGTRTVIRRGRLDLTLVTKLALGVTHEVTEVGGTATAFAPGTSLTVPGGFLAVASNSGRAERDHFSVLPESTVAVGYRVTERLSASVGYNFLYLSDVARPAEQIDRTINVSQVPVLGGGPLVGVVRPTHDIVGTDYWLQGVQFGVSYKY